jgi:hypothetical protein
MGTSAFRERAFEKTLEEALQPGRFIAYNASFDFVQGLEDVHTRLKAMVDAGEGAAAAAHLETFVAACYEKADEIDDSSGGLGQLVRDLFCTWVRARQAAEGDAAETVGLLACWMEHEPSTLERAKSRWPNRKGL